MYTTLVSKVRRYQKPRMIQNLIDKQEFSTLEARFEPTKKTHPIGFFAAFRTPDNKVQFGYSLCRTIDRHAFDRTVGTEIAIRRAQKGSLKFPTGMKHQFADFYYRAKAYFKNCSMPALENFTFSQLPKNAQKEENAE